MVAKLDIKEQKIFAINGETSEFGNFTGSEEKDLDIIQTAAFEGGFADAVQANETPTLEDVNTALYVATRQIVYNQQSGINEYSEDIEYHTDSVVRDGKGVYVSIQDENTGHALTESSWWLKAFDLDAVKSGLGTDSVKQTITKNSTTKINWSGSVRDDNDVVDIISLTPIEATLSGASPSATYYMFAVIRGTTVTAEFDDNINGTNLAANDGKRMVLPIITNGSSQISDATYLTDKNEIRMYYNVAQTVSVASVGATYKDFSLPVPATLCRPIHTVHYVNSLDNVNNNIFAETTIFPETKIHSGRNWATVTGIHGTTVTESIPTENRIIKVRNDTSVCDNLFISVDGYVVNV